MTKYNYKTEPTSQTVETIQQENASNHGKYRKKNRKRIEKERVLDTGQNLMGAWAKNGTKLDNNLTQLN